VGLIVPNIKNPFYSKICWQIESILNRKKYKTIICNTNHNPDKEKSYIQALENNGVDGIILVSGENLESLLQISRNSDISCVLMDRTLQTNDIYSVNLDNVYGGKLATQHLIKSGHKKIAFITSSNTQAERERLKGYKMSLKEYNISVPEEYIISKPEEDFKSDYSNLLNLLELSNPPTAIFASNDYKAIKILGIFREKNISVPGDISLIGFDDIETSYLLGLTTIKQPIAKMTELTINNLLEKQNKDIDAKKNKSDILKPELILRKTTRKI